MKDKKNNKPEISFKQEPKKVQGDRYNSGYEIIGERRLSKGEQEHVSFKKSLQGFLSAVGVLLFIVLFILGHFAGYDSDKPITLALCISGLIYTIAGIILAFMAVLK